MVSLYLLSHQDDELGILHDLSMAAARGERCVCAYLTDGAWGGVAAETRNRESLKVLTSLGIKPNDVHFIGEQVGISDGSLVQHMDAALQALAQLCARYEPVGRLVIQAWEGGHQDHDATHLVGRALAMRLTPSPSSWQYHLYRSRRGASGMSFASPCPEAGHVVSTPIPIGHRLRYLALVRHYRSQAHVMLRIWPHIVRVILIGGIQRLQQLPPVKELSRRPAERLLYEEWGLFSYAEFACYASRFVTMHLGSDSARDAVDE